MKDRKEVFGAWGTRQIAHIIRIFRHASNCKKRYEKNRALRVMKVSYVLPIIVALVLTRYEQFGLWTSIMVGFAGGLALFAVVALILWLTTVRPRRIDS